ncbi:MAG: class I SAM-dependent methyltransferase [Calditrichaeota bacterium]|jgi:SAM-dependent methyltransferase|nr:class I SAM-dependent methyltransferase [Calditrichota bacterium]MBT7788617.1 class I SAM-dependent methyltransferase [Calditrichota bacterium]
MNYYDNNYKDFIARTLDVDMMELYTPFCDRLNPGSSILDIGCGPGRDLKYFKSIGYVPLGLEPSRQLADYGRRYSGCEIVETTIQDFQSDTLFDGIWACASLLHLSSGELGGALHKITGLMHSGSVFYCSFKLGNHEGIRNGRYFNDQTLDSFVEYIPEALKVSHSWISEDLRPQTLQKWLNVHLELRQRH